MNLKEILSYVKAASQHKNVGFQFFDILYHKLKINTSPIDYYRFQFYNKSLPMERKERYVGKRASCFYPWQENKVQYTPLFDNKYIFKTLVQGFGLPQAKYLTSIGKDYEIKTFGHFEDFILHNTSSIVLKPIDGSGGRGIIVASYKEGGLRILEKIASARDVWHDINEGRQPYLVEERVEQATELSDIYPGSLNTMRIKTIKAEDNEWYILGTWIKFGQNRSQVDNVGKGGITLQIDPNGRSSYAYDWTHKKEVDSHPDTGAALTGIEIKQYAPAVNLALEASKKFGFMGTIGWDIGLSTNGPVLIEGNMFYDCFYWQYGAQGPLIPSHLTNKLKRHMWWQRWDKTAMYGKTDRRNIKA